MTKTFDEWTGKLEKSRSGGCLGALGGDLETKNLSKAVLADFGQFCSGSDRLKSRPNGARWRQLGAKIGAKMVILRPFGELFGAFLVVLGAIFRKMAEV